jgi:hypothetical protein
MVTVGTVLCCHTPSTNTGTVRLYEL